ncbi:MAG TPA: hypothetical protein DCL06_11265 [Corynebacterium variabile]|uniref:Uncharacterized protein n=1 Tax=Corynebacterium variabile TaxID=1727 RepID=A0A3B9QXA3_9CORY|nr:hypothetical protein [Corynebacterium variabile]
MSELVTVHPASRGVDDDGRPLPTPPDREITAKTVQMLSAADMSDKDKDGNVQVVRIWCAAEDIPNDGDDVTIRGLRFQVRQKGWNPGLHRRPVFTRHRPSAVFDAARGEG